MAVMVSPDAAKIEVSAAHFKDLQDEIHLLKAICRKAGAILSHDDNFETIKRRFDGGLGDEYHAAKAAYFQRFGRSAP